MSDNNLNKSIQELDSLIKGGKRAVIGEQRMFAGRLHVKTQDGWKFVGKGTGTKAQTHVEGSKAHIEKDPSITSKNHPENKNVEKNKLTGKYDPSKLDKDFYVGVRGSRAVTSHKAALINLDASGWKETSSKSISVPDGSNMGNTRLFIHPDSDRVLSLFINYGVENSDNSFNLSVIPNASKQAKPGDLHDDGTHTMIDSNGSKVWLNSAVKKHRDGDKPAVIQKDGTKSWYQKDKLHREGDKPAVEFSDGTMVFYKNGKIHRSGDQPAAIFPDGEQQWHQNGKKHRSGGKPAMIFADGTQEYWENGEQYEPKNKNISKHASKEETNGAEVNSEAHSTAMSLLEGRDLMTFESWLTAMGTNSEDLSKSKDSFLDHPIYVESQTTINYSGAWSVPNPSHTTTYFIGEKMPNLNEIKEKIANNKIKEREHRKWQAKKDLAHDYRYQRDSSKTTSYEVTTLRKVLKKFNDRPQSFHGTMGSTNYGFYIGKFK